MLDLALDQVKNNTLAKGLLKVQGVDLDDPQVVARIRRDLAPDAEILRKDLLHPLAVGFSTAGRASAQVATIFVACGALSSLLLPNTRRKPGSETVAMAH